MHKVGDDFALVAQDLWDEFLFETQLEPDTLGHDVLLWYRGVELRPSAAH